MKYKKFSRGTMATVPTCIICRQNDPDDTGACTQARSSVYATALTASMSVSSVASQRSCRQRTMAHPPPGAHACACAHSRVGTVALARASVRRAPVHPRVTTVLPAGGRPCLGDTWRQCHRPDQVHTYMRVPRRAAPRRAPPFLPRRHVQRAVQAPGHRIPSILVLGTNGTNVATRPKLAAGVTIIHSMRSQCLVTCMARKLYAHARAHGQHLADMACHIFNASEHADGERRELPIWRYPKIDLVESFPALPLGSPVGSRRSPSACSEKKTVFPGI